MKMKLFSDKKNKIFYIYFLLIIILVIPLALLGIFLYGQGIINFVYSTNNNYLTDLTRHQAKLFEKEVEDKYKELKNIIRRAEYNFEHGYYKDPKDFEKEINNEAQLLGYKRIFLINNNDEIIDFKNICDYKSDLNFIAYENADQKLMDLHNKLKSSDFKYVAGTGHVVGRALIEFVEPVEPDGVSLRNAVHRLSGLHDVGFGGVLTRGLPLLLFQIDGRAGLRLVGAVFVVVAAQAAFAGLVTLGQRGVGVARFCDDVKHTVAFAQTCHDGGIASIGIADRLTAMVLALVLDHVVLMQIVTLYEVDQQRGIARICGISAAFQPVRPTLIVGHFQIKKRGVARFFEEKGMVLVTLAHRTIHTEFFIARIVVLAYVRT